MQGAEVSDRARHVRPHRVREPQGLGNWLGIIEADALGGLPEEADGQVDGIEEGETTGADALDGAAEDVLILVGLGPEADQEALTRERVAMHGWKLLERCEGMSKEVPSSGRRKEGVDRRRRRDDEKSELVTFEHGAHLLSTRGRGPQSEEGTATRREHKLGGG